jgi:nucleoid-associated protein YejK
MTAKERLRAAVETRHNGGRDALSDLLDNAPLDDEPSTPEEEAAVTVAREQLARGETVSLDEIRSEFA